MKAHQVGWLLESYRKRDHERFVLSAKAIIEDERRLRHEDVARSLEASLGEASRWKGLPLTELPKHGSDPLCDLLPAEVALADMVLAEELRAALDDLVFELQHADDLRGQGHRPARVVLFRGPSGTGKTMAAEAVAQALGWPFVLASCDSVVGSYLGDTMTNLGRIVRWCEGNGRVVLFLDEFDSLGAARDDRSDVAEMRRVVNTLLQLFDRRGSEHLTICATNLPQMLDFALERRFDLALDFNLPDEAQRVELGSRLGTDLGQLDLRGSQPSHAVFTREARRLQKQRLIGELRNRHGQPQPDDPKAYHAAQLGLFEDDETEGGE